eukprot:403333923
MPSVSALDNGISFDINLQIHQAQNLREQPDLIIETPRRCVLNHSPIKYKQDPITSASKSKRNHHRKNSQIENLLQMSPQNPQTHSSSLIKNPQSKLYNSQINQHDSPSKQVFKNSYKNSPVKQNNRYSQIKKINDSLATINNDSPPKHQLEVPQPNQSTSNYHASQQPDQIIPIDCTKKSLSKERRSRQNRLKRPDQQPFQNPLQNSIPGQIKQVLGNSTNTIHNQVEQNCQIKCFNEPQHYEIDFNLQELDYKEQIKLQQIENLQQRIAAKKIQRVFRTYLLWQRIKRRTEMSVERKRQGKLQKILAAKIIVRQVKQWLQYRRAKNLRKHIVSSIVKIQTFIKRKQLRMYIDKRIKARKLIFGLFQGWKTRKIVNSLSKEIQDYVNQDQGYHKMRLKSHFLVLYENVQKNELWLSKNQFRLQRLQSLQQSLQQHKYKNKTPTKSGNQTLNSHTPTSSSNVNDSTCRTTNMNRKQQDRIVEWSALPCGSQQQNNRNKAEISQKSQQQLSGSTSKSNVQICKNTTDTRNMRSSNVQIQNSSISGHSGISVGSKDIEIDTNQNQQNSKQRQCHQKTVSYDSFNRVNHAQLQQIGQQDQSKCIIESVSVSHPQKVEKHKRNVSQISICRDSQISTNIPNTLAVTPRNISQVREIKKETVGQNQTQQNPRLSVAQQVQQRRSTQPNQNVTVKIASSKVDCWRQSVPPQTMNESASSIKLCQPRHQNITRNKSPIISHQNARVQQASLTKLQPYEKKNDQTLNDTKQSIQRTSTTPLQKCHQKNTKSMQMNSTNSNLSKHIRDSSITLNSAVQLNQVQYFNQQQMQNTVNYQKMQNNMNMPLQNSSSSSSVRNLINQQTNCNSQLKQLTSDQSIQSLHQSITKNLSQSFINPMEQNTRQNSQQSNKNNMRSSSISSALGSQNNVEYLQYKKCLHEIEEILDNVYEKNLNSQLETKSQLSLSQKMKIGQKFNVSIRKVQFYQIKLQKLVNELKDQYGIVSQIGATQSQKRL